jgi:hypothetical protein
MFKYRSRVGMVDCGMMDVIFGFVYLLYIFDMNID